MVVSASAVSADASQYEDDETIKIKMRENKMKFWMYACCEVANLVFFCAELKIRCRYGS